MDKFTTVTVEARDAIEILSLNRPDALNAVTPAMADELIAYFSGLHDRLTTRIVIFRGNGRAFCAGAELGSEAFAASGGASAAATRHAAALLADHPPDAELSAADHRPWFRARHAAPGFRCC